MLKRFFLFLNFILSFLNTNTEMFKITLKSLRVDGKYFQTAKSLSSKLFINKKSCAHVNLQLKTNEFVNKSFISTSQSDFNDPKSSNVKKLKLMNMPLTKFPNIFTLIGLRLRIAFQMMQLDRSFGFDDFMMGAEQVTFSSFESLQKEKKE